MIVRRALLLIPIVAASALGCRLLRPMDPHASDTAPEATDVAAAPATDVAAAPAADPAQAPAQQAEPPRVGRVTDATITAMLLASNNTDISYALLVPSRSERADVRQFAERMRTDHTVVNNLVAEVTAKLDMVPEENAASLGLRDESAARRASLRDLRGFAFDSAYVTNEISYHRRFLESVDLVMLPGARNEEIRTLLTNVRPILAAHLAHAEQLWANVMTRK